MKVLVVGGGGREHAIVYALNKSPKVEKIYCAPGNAGIAELAECVPIKATEIDALVTYALDEKFDLVFIAPDDPLAMGLSDQMQAAGIRTFGPKANAARIEASKSFAKDLMKKYNIPTAAYEVFSDMDAALSYLDTTAFPIVIKADGLALGKGVIIAENLLDAKAAVRSMMGDAIFNESGKTVVIEEFMVGPELTVLAFVDGTNVLPMISSRDHKRALDGDKGKNTGGMGAITPGAELTEEYEAVLHEQIFQPTVDALQKEGCPFVGIIYFGLMLTKDGPKVIEYNARMGDPETQAIIPRLESDFVDVIDACIDGRLPEVRLRWKSCASCCVVLASGGYPDKYDIDYPISGLESTQHLVFHAGTARKGQEIVTAGGRVLAVYGEGVTMKDAIDDAYAGVEGISFQNMHFRKDIGMV